MQGVPYHPLYWGGYFRTIVPIGPRVRGLRVEDFFCSGVAWDWLASAARAHKTNTHTPLNAGVPPVSQHPTRFDKSSYPLWGWLGMLSPIPWECVCGQLFWWQTLVTMVAVRILISSHTLWRPALRLFRDTSLYSITPREGLQAIICQINYCSNQIGLFGRSTWY